ncbi:MAG: PhoH family protein [Flavobacteriia bacterium]|nr:PhoH family protein [Flavobacteriia bacterium]
MTEKTVLLEDTNPQEFYGANNRYFNLLKSFYPKLKITARGDKIKINGDEAIIEQFEEKLNLILLHLQRYNSITENQIERIVMEDGREVAKTYAAVDDVLVHGSGGKLIKARTLNQKKMVQAIDENDMLFAIGPAGTGKTYTGVALAVRALKNKEVRRIILTRPAVEAGENLGFLPGDMKEKLDPYMQPLYDALHDMIPHEKLQYYLESRVIEIAPLAFMRGRTLDHAFVILDEAQNTTHAQMKMFLTRMGRSAKFIVTGDATQIDLPRNQGSGLKEALRILDKVDGISVVKLDDKDVIRHPLVKDIIHAYDKEEKK